MARGFDEDAPDEAAWATWKLEAYGGRARHLGLPTLLVNNLGPAALAAPCVGGAMAFSPKGELIGHLPIQTEGVLSVDLGTPGRSRDPLRRSLTAVTTDLGWDRPTAVRRSRCRTVRPGGSRRRTQHLLEQADELRRREDDQEVSPSASVDGEGCVRRRANENEGAGVSR